MVATTIVSVVRWLNPGAPTNAFTCREEQGFEALVRELEGNSAVLETAIDYRGSKHTVWGISARNREQNFALNLLMDPEVDFVSLVGTAGTGKTLLALAAGLHPDAGRKPLQGNHHDARHRAGR